MAAVCLLAGLEDHGLPVSLDLSILVAEAWVDDCELVDAGADDESQDQERQAKGFLLSATYVFWSRHLEVEPRGHSEGQDEGGDGQEEGHSEREVVPHVLVEGPEAEEEPVYDFRSFSARPLTFSATLPRA